VEVFENYYGFSATVLSFLITAATAIASFNCRLICHFFWSFTGLHTLLLIKTLKVMGLGLL